MMRNAFPFILKTFFVLKILNFCTDFFTCVGKRLDEKAKVSSKIYDVTTWKTNNYNICIATRSQEVKTISH